MIWSAIQTALYVLWAAFVSPLPFFESMEAVKRKLDADIREEARQNRVQWLAAAAAGTVQLDVAAKRLREIDALLGEQR